MTDRSTAAVYPYRNKAGKAVPGVTTIIGLLNKPALVAWAWKLGIEGQDINKVKEKAAEIGILTHYMCECKLKGQIPNLDEFKPAAVKVATPMFEAFCKWYEGQNIKAIAVEEGVVSENWQYGTRIDMVAYDTEALALYDIKTSKGVYDEYKIQLSANVEAWDEVHPDQPIALAKVIELDKETGRLLLHEFKTAELKDPYFEIFKHLKAIYVLQKK